MNTPRSLVAATALTLLALATSPAARAQQTPPPPPTPADTANAAALFSPGNQVQAGRLPFTLRQVFHRLGHDREETMAFTELRAFAISKNPLRQTGTLRSSKENGLSLSYESAKPHIIIVDDKGLIDRQPGGGERQVTIADHPELSTLTDLYLNLLRGNADKLFSYADVFYTGTDHNWQMGLVPHDPGLTKRVGKVVISGNGHDIRRIENVLPDGGSRTLEFGRVQRNPKYTPDEIKMYFRGAS